MNYFQYFSIISRLLSLHPHDFKSDKIKENMTNSQSLFILLEEKFLITKPRTKKV